MPAELNPAQMLEQMSGGALSASDLKAICKSRGFSDAEAASPSLFAHVFLSPTGVTRVLESLSEAEIAALWLLRLYDRDVDIAYFARVYGQGEADHSTFTRRYKDVFEAVRNNLVRKGVLLAGLVQATSSSMTKMQLWRFRLPAEVGALLPPLLGPLARAADVGTPGPDVLRDDLRTLARGQAPDRKRAGIQLGADGLTLDRQPFNLSGWMAWHLAAWDAALLRMLRQGSGQRGTYNMWAYVDANAYEAGDPFIMPKPLPLLTLAFVQLDPADWIAAEQFDVLLDIAYARVARPTAAAICTAGWETGCLVRHEVDGRTVYRLARPVYGTAPAELARHLSTVEGKVLIDVERVPYEALEILNWVANFAPERGALRVTPSLVKLAQQWHNLGSHPFLRYLGTHSSVFGAALDKLDAQWGRLVVHENLLVARVTNLSLRVALEQALATGGPAAEQPIRLADQYLAIPRARLPEIEKAVRKAGHVIKLVRAT